MESILSIITSLLFAVTGATAGAETPAAAGPSSVEIGLAELSPAGEAGGYAMPASGCSAADWHGRGLHDCNQQPLIDVDDPIVRMGENTTLRWNPNGISNCRLLGNLTNQGPVSRAGSEVITPFADTTYVIVCDNQSAYTQSVTVRVLPRIQET